MNTYQFYNTNATVQASCLRDVARAWGVVGLAASSPMGITKQVDFTAHAYGGSYG